METTGSFSTSILWKPWIVLQLVFYGNHGDLFRLYTMETKDSCSDRISWNSKLYYLSQKSTTRFTQPATFSQNHIPSRKPVIFRCKPKPFIWPLPYTLNDQYQADCFLQS